MGIVLEEGLICLHPFHGTGQAVGEDVLIPYVIYVGTEAVLIPALGFEIFQYFQRLIHILHIRIQIIFFLLILADRRVFAAEFFGRRLVTTAAGGQGEQHHARQ